jgi:3-hydroxymyristoyl/3-hydroxydecanoyl-(acyl carrier protein) dehydratase
VDPASALLRLLGRLIAERVEVNLAPLYPLEKVEVLASPQKTSHREPIRVGFGGEPFQPPLPLVANPPSPLYQGGIGKVTSPDKGRTGGVNEDPLFSLFAAAQEARIKAHDAFLRFSERIAGSMEKAIALQLSLQDALGEESLLEGLPSEAQQNPLFPLPPEPNPPCPPFQGGINMAPEQSPPLIRGGREGLNIVFNREMCMEFARGSVGRMLGPAFAEADTFPTRVRLPDEPLMLVDRIVALEGEARSMTCGRVATEHDIHSNAWYLDAGRIPTCIAVEAGQADLFLSGYLGIDFQTRGLAVYRLLDAVVTFHRKLPGAGETIHYDIRIEHFFKQGETRFFRFRFDATVAGEPLLTMRDGCAGFFTAEELAAGRGIVHSTLDRRSRSGSRPADWEELAPMAPEAYDDARLDLLREGDLGGCFGVLFAGLGLNRPLTIPGGRMRLVHRVTALDPLGGRYGLGLIRAEADIHPDDWFLTCHFVDDRVMPGTLMYECCLHTLRIFLLRMGWVAEAAGSAWEPVPGVASRLCCRGQVLETTRIVAYEVSIRELGYLPEPYAIVDALMYADNKPIVEITGMSVRLSGTTRDKVTSLWRRQGVVKVCTDLSHPVSNDTGAKKPPIYTKEQILAYSNGKPSEGFGEPYRVFDNDRIIARLPGPPYQFMDRVTAVRGEPWQMVPGAMAESQYDIPSDAWYFTSEQRPHMPFAVLLEAALQPCGWLAAYVGSALTSAVDLSFRNLGGNALQHRPVTPESGVLTATAELKKAAASGGMIIQEYAFTVADRQGTLYEGETMFGFFSREALNNQVGIRDAVPHRPTAEEEERGEGLPYPKTRPFPEKILRMIDRIELFVHDGGPAGLGYIRGTKEVDPAEWFFKAHFYQDPVTPGSLGLEAFLQLLKFVAVERWGWREGDILSTVALNRRHNWLYRGQIVPTNSRVTVEAWITGVDDGERLLSADGILGVDGRLIYRMNDFTLQME